MKKTLIAVAAAAALTTSAFAEVSFGAWGRAIWAPIASNGDEAITFTSTSWGGDGRIGYGMDFTSENVDMHADFALEGGAADINDQLKVVVRPMENVSISIGKVQDDTLRGDACFGSWNWVRPSWISDEGITFSRTIDLKGVYAKLTPVEGLVILAGVPVAANGYSNTYIGCANDKLPDGKSNNLAENAYKAAKVGVGYTIDGVGQIKAQFLGNGSKDDLDKSYTGDFEVAFKLTSVENLTAEVGFKTTIMEEDAYVKWGKDADGNALVGDLDKAEIKLKGNTIALGASYKVNDATSVAANASVFLPSNSDIDPSMMFGVGVDYALDNGIGLTADVRVSMPQNDVDPSIGFLVGASKGFSNGKLSAGFQCVSVAENSGTGMVGSMAPAKDGNPEADGLVWAIPVCFEYWF